MTFKQHAYPLLIEPAASKSLILILGFFHLASLASVAFATLPLVASALAFVAIVLSFIYCLRRCKRPLSITWDSQGDWQLATASDARFSARLCGSSIVTRYFVWLHLRTKNQRFHSFLLPWDSLSADGFRRLRVRLLIEGVASDDSDTIAR
jgi:hypothetical protein